MKAVEKIEIEGVPDTFLLKHILSKEECKAILEGVQHKENIEQFNEGGVQRRVMRLQVMHDQLGEWLYSVISPYLVQEYTIADKDEKEFGKLAQGTWKLSAVNPNFRFCKYDSCKWGE